jgi:hypothetical protein
MQVLLVVINDNEAGAVKARLGSPLLTSEPVSSERQVFSVQGGGYEYLLGELAGVNIVLMR